MDTAMMTNDNIEKARFNMVEQQIRTWDVLDEKILNIVRTIHREEFVPESFESLAFADLCIPLAHEQEMFTPKLEARILQTLNIQPSDSVLEVGTGAGYLTACLSKLAAKVHSIDYYADFINDTKVRLENFSTLNVTLEQKDFYELLKLPQTFDVIVLSGSIPIYDERIPKLLAPGGRLFVVVGIEALLIERIDETHWKQTSLFETQLLPLINAKPQQQFQF